MPGQIAAGTACFFAGVVCTLLVLFHVVTGRLGLVLAVVGAVDYIVAVLVIADARKKR